MFTRWLETQLAPFPGEPDRRPDCVAEFVSASGTQPPWACLVEPQADFLARVVQYLTLLHLELRTGWRDRDRYQMMAGILNVSGARLQSVIDWRPRTPGRVLLLFLAAAADKERVGHLARRRRGPWGGRIPMAYAPSSPPRRAGLCCLVGALALAAPAAGDGPSAAPPRVRLFRIQPGFLHDPPGLDAAADGDDGLERVSFAFGSDNPHFDFRRKGDPGGVGYTRVNTQLLLIDTAATACSLGLQAVAPAGIEQDGLPEGKGPTVLTPALSLFHAVDDHLAVQAFVGTNVPLANRAAQPVRRDVQCGVAVQTPLFGEGADVLRGLFVSVGALGQLRPEREARSPTWELVPGLYYRLAEHWWISGGLSMPVGPGRPDAAQGWQVTCSLQF